MSKINLSKYGIKGTTEVLYNPTYEVLYNEETKPGLEGYDKGQVTELGAINVMTGVYTGRSPKDKYIVMDKNSKDTVWWDSEEYHNDNHPMSEKVWKTVKKLAINQLCGKKLTDDEVKNLLSLADLDPALCSKPASELSVGQVQRVALARTLANDPEACAPPPLVRFVFPAVSSMASLRSWRLPSVAAGAAVG